VKESKMGVVGDDHTQATRRAARDCHAADRVGSTAGRSLRTTLRGPNRAPSQLPAALEHWSECFAHQS
jgi:hypothetical protein